MSGRKSEPTLVIVGAPPPPFHGQALVTQQVFEMNWSPREVYKIEARFSSSIEDVGSAGLAKLLVLLKVAYKMLFARFRLGAEALYITAGSANWVPLVRDVILIGLIGRLYKSVFVHYHSGGLPEWFDQSNLAKVLGKWAYGGATVAIGLSEAVAVPCFEKTRKAIVRNGVEAPPKLESKERNEKRRLLFIGALRSGKGVDILLDAVDLLQKRNVDDFEIEFVGDWISKDYEKAVRERVEEARLSKRVIFSGILSGSEKWMALQRADFFVFPSHYQSENQPLVVIEAMAMGVPVISTKWRGIPEMVLEGETGFLVEPQNSHSLADTLATAFEMTNQQLHEMGENSRERFSNHFSVTAFSARMREVIASRKE
jgi:glycosyltransferase involved in cell wall biosynthesis